MKPAILFFGDSYANCGRNSFKDCNQTVDTSYPVWEDILADYLGMDQMIFGYGGASWWFSRCRMLDYFRHNFDALGRVEVVVALHTNSSRINSSHREIIQDVEYNHYYASEAYDQRFHDWAQKQWFREFSNIFRDKKIINIFCYPLNTQQSSDLPHDTDLRGMIVEDPMIHVTVSEFAGTRRQIDYAIANSNDMPGNKNPHHNHMNAHNHRVLADQLVGLINDYKEQRVRLDFQKFAVINPNYKNWPDGRYWTQD
jgi:hypothetical protein